MKISSLAITLLASPAMAFPEYQGFAAVNDDTSVAICGKDLWGCAGKAFCSRVALAPGGSQSIGSRAQTWIHDQGMLQNRADNRCLGVAKSRWSSSSVSPLDSATTYSVRLYSCDDEDIAQRWLLGDDDRMHSVANYDLCLTIQSDTKEVLLEKGAPMQLAPCTTDEDNQVHRQRLQMIGVETSMKAFVHPTQPEYGIDDMVRLAFWTDEDLEDADKGTMEKLQVFEAPEESVGTTVTLKSINEEQDMTPLYTQSVSSHANMVEIAAWELLASLPQTGDDAPTRFIARLGSVESAPFSINSEEEHIAATCGHVGLWLPIILSAVVVSALVMLVIVGVLRRRRAARTTTSGKHVYSADEGDTQTQASDEEESQMKASAEVE